MPKQTKNPTGSLNPEQKKEPEKFNGREQGSLYDKVFKENMEETLSDIIKDVLGLQIVNSEEIPDDLQHTKERKPDLLKKVEDQDGNIYILHLEYQKDDDQLIVWRIAEYYIMLYRKYSLPIVQFVIYIGNGKPGMPTIIKTKYLNFWFRLVSLSDVDYRVFLKSEKIEQRMLAILGDLATESIEEVLEQILLDIESLNLGELIEGRYRRQLRVLLELRNLDEQTLKDMALVGKIFEEEKDILYRRGEMKGSELERVKAKAEKMDIARNFKKMGVAIENIAKGTGLSIAEIEAL